MSFRIRNILPIAEKAALVTALIGMIFVARPDSLYAGEYVSVEQGKSVFHLYRARADELSIHWKDVDGGVMRTFDAVLSHLKAEGKQVAFLTNGGIFEPGGVPSGLHIEAGKELRPLNLAAGKGNFFLKPNGVLFIKGSKASIVESAAYAAMKPAPSPRLALQSGPMLIIDGKTHPKFRAGSKSRLHRNGVGILSDGRLLFIMTDLTSGTRTNLFQFAALFRRYGCQNALFLDGDLSMMRVDDGKTIEPADARDPAKRELAPGIPAGDKFGAMLAIAVDTPDEIGAKKEAAGEK